MKAEIISVGTELLLGEITDTNASFLAGQLPALGIDLFWISQVGDNQSRLVELLRRARERSDVALLTGGLGPTQDDITREAIAELCGETPEVQPDLADEMKAFFRRRGIEMSLNNLKQATLIPSARVLPNPRGTAPGWWVEKDGFTVISMPGPPGEMQFMWRNEVLPRLSLICTGTVIISTTLKTFGLAESKVDEMLAELLRSANPTIGIYARPDGIQLRLAAKASSEAEARSIMAPAEERIRFLLDGYIWGTDSDTLESVVGNMIQGRGLTLATLEWGSGGQLTALISSNPGCEAYFRGGMVLGGPGSIADYGIKAGSAPIETVQALAEAAQVRLKADIGLSVAIIPEPLSLSSRPAGNVFISVSDGEKIGATRSQFPGDVAQVRRRGIIAALFELRKFLAGTGSGQVK